jgi:muramoyltetrapeptide carboxypeptidase
MKILKPSALKEGDTLGIVTCSTPMTACGPETIERAYQRLRDHGFSWIEASNCRKTHGHAAGTIRERAREIHDFFKNPKVHGILNFWGGYQSHQLLEYLDYDLISRNPKAFIGYSDTTALQTGIFSKTGLITFSGPAGITFGKPTLPDFTWRHFDQVLINPEVPLKLSASKEYSDNSWYLEPDKKMNFEPNPGWKIYRRGKGRGRIIGGNIGTMLLLAGTDYWPNLRGKILLVEEDESESSKTIDRMFTQLRQMGVYDQIAGMVVGRFHRNVKFNENDSLEMILDDALKGYKFPVITGVDFGHTDPLITFPIGIRCHMDTAKPEISFDEAAVTTQSPS